MHITEFPSLLRSHTANGHVDEHQTNNSAAQTNQLKKSKHVNSFHISHHIKKIGRGTSNDTPSYNSTQRPERHRQERAEDSQEQAEGKRAQAEDKREQAEGKHSFQNENMSLINRVYHELNI